MDAKNRLINYPLRQALLPGAPDLRIFEAVGPIDWLAKPDRFLVLCDDTGGRILAANEMALEEAQTLIRDAHGADVILNAPEALTFLDTKRAETVEPVMFLRVRVLRAQTNRVLDELRSRDLAVLEEDVQREHMVIRAEGRLADMIGCVQALRKLTEAEGGVETWSWLLRYDAVADEASATEAKGKAKATATAA